MPVWALSNPIPIGEVGKAHGYKGAFKVNLDKGKSEIVNGALVPGSYIFLSLHKKPVPYRLLSWSWSGEDQAICALEEVRDEAAAKGLRGVNIILPGAMILESEGDDALDVDEAYPGCLVRDEAENDLGRVVQYISQAAGNDLLEVSYNFGTYYIPVHPDMILDEDFDNKILLVRLPTGLIDLAQAEEG